MPDAPGSKGAENRADERDVAVAAFTRLSQWRAYMFGALRKAGIESAELDTRLLLCHALHLDDMAYFSDPQRSVDTAAARSIESCLQRRLAGEPVSRILGFRSFWKHDFRLGPQTLDPRPDSETLIETALQLITPVREAAQLQGRRLRILDLGTGTGALLISLLLELPEAEGIGVDISGEAIQMAAQNAQRLQCAKRVVFLEQNWLDELIKERIEGFDLIVCNPPYIPHAQIDGLSREVRVYDPLRALDGGEDGLDPYREIIPQLHRVLGPAGIVVFEIGTGQHVEVTNLMRAFGFHAAGGSKGWFRDLAGVIRCVAASRDSSLAANENHVYNQPKE